MNNHAALLQGETELLSLARRPYDAKSTRAIWLQIYDRLGMAIEDGVCPPGSRLPGEVQLAEMFGVSRITVRRALAMHQSEGTLQARKGVGIFVRQNRRAFVIRNDMRFSEALVGRGEDTTSRILRLDRGRPSPQAQDLFGLAPEDEVIVLHRLRLLDSAPIYVTHKELPAYRFPDFERLFHEWNSVSAVYEASGIPWFRRAETRISGRLAQPEEAAILGISAKAPVQYVTSVNRTRDGEAIEFNRGCWPMMSVEFVFDNSPEAEC